MMKIKIIKFYFFLIVIATLISSCANESAVATDAAPSDVSDGVTCVIPEPVYDIDGVVSRSTITPNSSGMSFKWDDGEKINIFGTDQNRMDFTLKSKDESGKTGKFDGGGFDLTANKVYYSISKSSSSYGENNDKHNVPCINGVYTDFNSDQYTNIKLSYEGQRQTVNETTFGKTTEAYAHLGAYDYMTAEATASSGNSATFYFHRLSCILRIVIKGLPEGVAFKQLTMYDASENEFREMKRTANITNTSSTTEYLPYLNAVTLSDASPRFSIMLGTQESGEEQGISVSSGQSLVVYMMIPPVDMTGRTIAFRLTPVSSDKTAYFGTYTGRAFASNTAVQMTMTATKCEKYNINVKVVKDWNKGNVVSRATGDPGNTVTLAKPKYLYAFFVNAGRLVGRAYASDIAESNWTDADGLYSYTGSWKNTSNGTNETETTSLTLDATNGTNPRVYIVASNSAIESWKDASGNAVSFAYGTTNGTEESVIQGMTYDFTNQNQILNLYTTPATPTLYNSSSLSSTSDASYAGALGDDVKDVRLYHVASKVDINWESASALSGNVSVNKIPTTNLSFFKPTTNTTGTGAVSTTLDTGSAYNGRAVFYVPQVSGGTYNVTIGSKTQDIQFTPDATYTSWFRGLVTVE